jgi:hypothetical protein
VSSRSRPPDPDDEAFRWRWRQKRRLPFDLVFISLMAVALASLIGVAAGMVWLRLLDGP